MDTRPANAVLLAVMVWLIAPVSAIAQPTAVVSGVATDGTDGVIAGETVTLVASDGSTHVAITDPMSRYRFAGLAPGPARLSFAAEGFEAFRAAIDVRAGRQAVFTIVLTVGFHETVEVTTTSTAESDAGVVRTLTGQDLAALPSDPQVLLRRLQDMVGAASADDMSVLVDGFEQHDRVPRREVIQAILPSRAFDTWSDRHAVRASWMRIRARSVHDVRLEWRRRRSDAGVSNNPALVALDAFSAGGNQDLLFSEGRHGSVQLRVVQQPTFFPQAPDALVAEAGRQTRYWLPDQLALPRSLLSSMSWDHRLARDVGASFGVAWERGSRLLRRPTSRRRATTRQRARHRLAGVPSSNTTRRASRRGAS